MSREPAGKLTEGNIRDILIRLSAPIIASAFLSTLYSFMDMFWVGKLGAEMLAGVGIAGMFGWMAEAFARMAAVGGQIYVAQELGAGNKKQAGAYADAAIKLGVLIGIVYGAVCAIAAPRLISFFHLTSETAVRAGIQYMHIGTGLVVFYDIGFVLSNLFTAAGDSKTPMIANLTGLVLNMLLDPLLIFGIGPLPSLGVRGAAIATIFSEGVVALILIARIRKEPDKEHVLRAIRPLALPEAGCVRRVVRLGLPASIQEIVYSGITILLSRMVAGFGDVAVAVQKVGGQVESISWNVAMGISSAINAFSGQNYGAGKMPRIRDGFRISAGAVIVFSVCTSALMFLFPQTIARLFFHDAEGVAQMVRYLRIEALCQGFMNMELLSVGAISGMGNTRLANGISIAGTALRIPLALILIRLTPLGLAGIWWALAASSILKGTVLTAAFGWEYRRKSRVRQAGVIR